MQKFVKNVIDEFSINLVKSQAIASPETENIFKIDVIRPLKKNKAGLFYTTVDRGLLL